MRSLLQAPRGTEGHAGDHTLRVEDIQEIEVTREVLSGGAVILATRVIREAGATLGIKVIGPIRVAAATRAIKDFLVIDPVRDTEVILEGRPGPMAQLHATVARTEVATIQPARMVAGHLLGRTTALIPVDIPRALAA